MKRNRRSAEEKPDRKTVERNRRIHMKGLCLKLSSLIPPHHHSSPSNASKNILSQQDRIDQAANYIKKLTRRVEELKEKKERAIVGCGEANKDARETMGFAFEVPLVELKDLGSGLDVLVISGVRKSFMLNEVIGILEDEGAEVVSVSISTVGDKVFHFIHAQAKVSRLGIDTARVNQRLRQLLLAS